MFVLPTFVSLRETLAAAVQPAAKLLRALRNRRAVTRLCHLDDRALKDIGLTRSDVLGALAAPLSDDPSSILAEHARGGMAVPRARTIRCVSASRPATA